MRLFQLNAFTRELFRGNPAAVLLLDAPLPEPTMKQIAAEMRLSETAFVTTVPAGGDMRTAERFHMRWFTPQVEVSLCGHGTLATAALLFFTVGNEHGTLRFDTLSGELAAERVGTDQVAIFLPTYATVPLAEAGLPPLLLQRLVDDVLAAVLGDTPYSELHYVPARKRLVVRLDDERAGRAGLEALQPRFEEMLRVHDGSLLSSVTVTTRGHAAPYDFCSRHFSPWIGIPEDPVTGSAHSYLVTYWAPQLQKRHFLARQCSPRGGDLDIHLLDDGRIKIVGSTAMFFEGQAHL